MFKTTINYFLIQLSLLCLVSFSFSYTTLTPSEVQEKLNSASGAIIIDVREESEFCSEGGHIPGALNYPYSSGVLQETYDELDSEDEMVIVCASGNRSSMASAFLENNGFTAILNMSGGMGAWGSDTETCEDTPIETDIPEDNPNETNDTTETNDEKIDSPNEEENEGEGEEEDDDDMEEEDDDDDDESSGCFIGVSSNHM